MISLSKAFRRFCEMLTNLLQRLRRLHIAVWVTIDCPNRNVVTCSYIAFTNVGLKVSQ